MIRHIVLFTARPGNDVQAIIDGLSILTRIPHARRLEISRNRKSDPMSKETDVIVYGEFDSDDDLAAYKAHPLYAQSTNCVRPMREIRFAADFDSDQAVTNNR